MATATMGLRRRVHQVSTTSSSPSTSGSSTSGGGSSAASTSSSSSSSSSNHSSGGANKRTRSENNNSPSQGNLNSPEPAPKKARNSSRVAAARAKELEMAKKVTPPHWSDTRQFASIAGLSLQDQAALCSNALPSPVSYLSSQMATFVGNAAASLGKTAGSASVSYLDISNMTAAGAAAAAAAGPRPNWPNQDAVSTADPISLAFSAAAAFPSTSRSNSSSSCATATTETAATTSPKQQQQQQQQPSITLLPRNFPNDAMFNTYQPWVIKTYGDLAKTKTITIKKYARILRTLRGEEVNSAENSKFRFWVKSKGFHIGQPEGYEAKPADRIIGRHAVSTPGLDPPLYVPTQPPHNKALNGAEGTVPPGRVYKKVAIVENFFDIIHAVHVDLEGRPGKHAGQKRTYRTITETYAFLPREAVTRFLLGCTECQRRPRTPSPTSTAAATAKAGSPSPTTSPSPTPDGKKDEPASPQPSTAAVQSRDAAAAEASSEQPKETSAACTESSKCKRAAIVAETDDKPEGPESSGEAMTPASTAAAALATTTMPSSDANAKSSCGEANSDNSASSEVKASSEISTTNRLLGNSHCNANEATATIKVRDEKYNPLSITNLLRKDPIKRRSPPIITTAYHQPFPASDAYAYTMTTTTAMSTDNRSSSPAASTYIRKLHSDDDKIAATAVTRPWSPSKVESKCSVLDYSRSFVPGEQAQVEEQATTKKKEIQTDGQPQNSTAIAVTTTTMTTTATAATMATMTTMATMATTAAATTTTTTTMTAMTMATKMTTAATSTSSTITTTAAAAVAAEKAASIKGLPCEADSETDDNGFSPTAGLIDTNLNLLATIQQLHCQVMLALTERLRPAVATSPAATDS